MPSRFSTLLIVLGLALLAGCSATPTKPQATAQNGILTPDSLRRGAEPEVIPEPPEHGAGGIALTQGGEHIQDHTLPPEIRIGTGRFVDEKIARMPPKGGGAEGQVVFNFENQPVQAVVKAILGDLLHDNYVIAPNVGGNVTFSSSQPIRADQAMSVLETLLSWTGNTLVYENGTYTVLQIKDAIPGKLPPRMGPVGDARGFELRVFPLRYISPSEMLKVLKPYVKPEGVVSADPARSLIVMAGTAAELANYQRTIETFDVDWLKGMSVGVFTLRHVEVEKLLPDLQKVFGTEGESPLAGMFRFLPITQVNSMVVITPNPEYLHTAEDWINRLDRGAGENGTQLYVYDVKNIKAPDLADYLNQIFVGSSAGTSRRSTYGEVGQGLKAVTIGGLGGSGGQVMDRRNSLRQPSATEKGAAAAPVAGATPVPGKEGSDIRISAIEENNQLLVMAMASEWDLIQSAIRKLDISPLQVQIEARILEVSLTGDLKFGVQWWFAGLQGASPRFDNGNPYRRPYDRHKGLLGAAGPGQSGTIFWSYLNSKFEVALSALESSGNAKALAAPSLVVMNNQEAQINVGTQIPIVQTYISPYSIASTGTNNNSTFSGTGSVQYLNTGVVLSVTPRVNPGGLVYMDVQQEVSNPGTPAEGSQNPPINQRQLQTSVAVQSGETVLLAGLIQENNSVSDTGVPFLNRLPLVGRLFGSTTHHRDRTELIVLITPRVIYNSEDARELTDEYQRQFESLAPLRSKTQATAPSVVPPPPPVREPAEVRPLDPQYQE